MNSLEKAHWWEKKSTLLFGAGLFGALALEPTLPGWAHIVAVALAGGCAGGGAVGVVEVGRAYAKARVEAANGAPKNTLTAD
jgi:hypothetical protein